jgi:hypothetical protein
MPGTSIIPLAEQGKGGPRRPSGTAAAGRCHPQAWYGRRTADLNAGPGGKAAALGRLRGIPPASGWHGLTQPCGMRPWPLFDSRFRLCMRERFFRFNLAVYVLDAPAHPIHGVH